MPIFALPWRASTTSTATKANATTVTIEVDLITAPPPLRSVEDVRAVDADEWVSVLGSCVTRLEYVMVREVLAELGEHVEMLRDEILCRRRPLVQRLLRARAGAAGVVEELQSTGCREAVGE